MKKLFKNHKVNYIIIGLLGIIIGGSIGITATTYVLQSSEIQYTSDKSVQQAIEELYVLAENGGSTQTLPISAIGVEGFRITIPYTGNYPVIRCVYGTDENYGNVGTISDNTCYFKGTNSNQQLYYKIVATDDAGKIYENSGNITTGECINIEDSGVCITTTKYTTGDAVELGGYKWHVISDIGTNLTLLMDANQLESYSNMGHCTYDTKDSTDCGTYTQCYSDGTCKTYYLYSWNKSKIRTYLNGTFLTNLQSKITNEIVATEICADPSKNYSSSTSYGGYLMSELSALGKTSSCSTKVTDKVRLISLSEFYNMSPYYTSASSSYPNVGNYIKKISSSSDYAKWLYCNSSSCGDSSGYWWTMGSVTSSYDSGVYAAHQVYNNGYFSSRQSDYLLGVRPVITIVK